MLTIGALTGRSAGDPLDGLASATAAALSHVLAAARRRARSLGKLVGAMLRPLQRLQRPPVAARLLGALRRGLARVAGVRGPPAAAGVI